jgi:cell shape-determining protein MreC
LGLIYLVVEKVFDAFSRYQHRISAFISVRDPHSSAKDNEPESGKLAAANKELRSLRNRLNEAEAENQRLQAQIARPSDNQSLSAANAAAVKEKPQLVEEKPRLSQ